MADISLLSSQGITALGITAASAGALVYLLMRAMNRQGGIINKSVAKDKSKVVHSVTVDDITDKGVFCRCWKSKQFPYCDGTHNKHNAQTKDNIGPLIIQK